jgi:DNA-binding transcriptional ArsR family regulator
MVMRMKPIQLSPEAAQLVKIFSALGSPTRFRILEIVAGNPESIVADVVEQLPIAQATVSQHLGLLRDAGLIYGERDGAAQCCRLDLETVSQFAQAVVAWTVRLAALGDRGGTKGSSCRS